MGPGCLTVQRVHTDSTDLGVATRPTGRIATVRGLRADTEEQDGRTFIYETILEIGPYESHELLAHVIAEFIRTGDPTVALSEALQLYDFMETAHESKCRGAEPVSLDAVIHRARTSADRRINTLFLQ